MEQTKIISKRLLAVIISLAMVFSLVQGGIFTASAAETSGDFWYRVLVDGTVEITGYSGSATELTIPSELDEKTVTSIGSYAFEHRTSLTKIVIPDSLVNIDSWAFSHCDSLTSIEIPKNVESISVSAFNYCGSLTNIDVVEDNTSYSDIDGVLFNKDKTKLIRYPIGKKENSYIIPNNVKSIDGIAFFQCNTLTRVEIPDSVESIGSNSFKDCGVYNNEEYWENGVFVIGNFLIKANADIEGECQIKENIKIIVDGAFDSCDSITSLNVAEGNTVFSAINGVLFNKDETVLLKYPIGRTDVEYIIPSHVNSIGDNAFSGCESLASIVIPNSVKSIGGEAFSSCESLTSIVIPNSVKSIGEYAFWCCTSLANFVIPNSVESIGNCAFYSCKALENITIPNSVKSIGYTAFFACQSLKSIDVEDNNINYCDIDGVLFNKDKTILMQYPLGKTDTSYTIPNTVENIDDSAFRKCEALENITIPNSVKKIGAKAFEFCDSLSTVNYGGTDEQWKQIDIDEENEWLINATRTYCQHTNTETDEAVAPTCGKVGLTEGSHCSDCGAVVVAQTEVAKTEHKNIVTDNAVAPTCDKTGLTEGSHCKDCGAKIKAQTVVKAKGHSTTVKNKKSATYFAKGYSGDTVCKVCKKTIKKGKAIAKKTLKTPKVKVTKGKKQFKVKYNKVSGATGFEVQYKIGKKAVTKSFNTKKSATKNIIKLKKGNYKVKVRAFVKSGKNKAYSKWSKTYKVNVK